ncbi:hypothetical protein [Chromobacterium violaceum]|uniref:hypothetical protein n=1 Tax=Chromobacterium violaceum TaxID=536 RepID=UPI00143DCFD6|nr:hypothetical protein [Chromobacterium violaceum]QIY81480.1 hypothetical protein FOB43_20930 [Chromobacterium violaceum]
MRTSVVIVAAALALAGCAEKPKIEQCWSAEAKQAINRMVLDLVMEAVGDQLKAGGKPYDAAAQETIKKNLHLDLDKFSVTDVNNAGVLTCSASVDMKFDKAEGGNLSGHINLLPFAVQPGEGGNYYVIPSVLPIKTMVDSAS